MRLIGSRVSGGRTVAATLAFDVQQPTVGFFLVILKGRKEISIVERRKRDERVKVPRIKAMSRL